MSLFEQWKELAEKERSNQEYEEFWKDYLGKEKNNYEKILTNPQEEISGKLSDLAAKYEMDQVTFMGFLDGINTSLVQPLEVESLTGDSEIKLDIDFEKLYFNMLDAKAEWLYNLEPWADVLDEEKRKQITKEFRKSQMAVSSKIGRNEPCTCGSGKKYKKCCGA